MRLRKTRMPFGRDGNFKLLLSNPCSRTCTDSSLAHRLQNSDAGNYRFLSLPSCPALLASLSKTPMTSSPWLLLAMSSKLLQSRRPMLGPHLSLPLLDAGRDSRVVPENAPLTSPAALWSSSTPLKVPVVFLESRVEETRHSTSLHTLLILCAYYPRSHRPSSLSTAGSVNAGIPPRLARRAPLTGPVRLALSAAWP
jgi:hypothetical protein